MTSFKFDPYLHVIDEDDIEKEGADSHINFSRKLSRSPLFNFCILGLMEEGDTASRQQARYSDNDTSNRGQRGGPI